MSAQGRRSPLARALILAAASGLVIILVRITSVLDILVGRALSPALRLPGVGVAGVGLGLIVWAEAALLRTTGSTGGFGDAPPSLVAHGPYRHTRNPIYLGGFLLLLGLAGWRGSWALLLASAAFLPLMHILVVSVEEPATRKRLGPAYEDFCSSVPRWLPRLRRQ